MRKQGAKSNKNTSTQKSKLQRNKKLKLTRVRPELFEKVTIPCSKDKD